MTYGQKFFKGSNEELSVGGRLAAGACAGMTSTLVKKYLSYCFISSLYFEQCVSCVCVVIDHILIQQKIVFFECAALWKLSG